MNAKSCIAIFLMFCSLPVFGQDKLFKKNGTVVDALIKSIGKETIAYTRFDNPSGPEYTIYKSSIEKVKYQNGSVVTFDQNNEYIPNTRVKDNQISKQSENYDLPNSGKASLPRNIVAFAPVQFTEIGMAGFSLSYEHVMDKNGLLSFSIPVILEFSSEGIKYNNQNYKNDPMVYLMPGIKIYPTGSNGLMKYAVGPSFVMAAGQTTVNGIQGPSYASYIPPPVTKNRALLGMMVNQSINVNPTSHLYLGVEFGFGFTYLSEVGGVYTGTEGLVQFNFKMGYRY